MIYRRGKQKKNGAAAKCDRNKGGNIKLDIKSL